MTHLFRGSNQGEAPSIAGKVLSRPGEGRLYDQHGSARLTIFADTEFVSVAVDALSEAFTNNGGHVAVIVFMPDHAHLILSGAHRDSDLLAMVKEFKQKTTFRARKTLPSFAWQKDFYDHIIRDETDYANQVRYILRNPVRAGLCDRWQDWPHRFVLGQTWEDLALNIATH